MRAKLGYPPDDDEASPNTGAVRTGRDPRRERGSSHKKNCSHATTDPAKIPTEQDIKAAERAEKALLADEAKTKKKRGGKKKGAKKGAVVSSSGVGGEQGVGPQQDRGATTTNTGVTTGPASIAPTPCRQRGSEEEETSLPQNINPASSEADVAAQLAETLLESDDDRVNAPPTNKALPIHLSTVPSSQATPADGTSPAGRDPEEVVLVRETTPPSPPPREQQLKTTLDEDSTTLSPPPGLNNSSKGPDQHQSPATTVDELLSEDNSSEKRPTTPDNSSEEAKTPPDAHDPLTLLSRGSTPAEGADAWRGGEQAEHDDRPAGGSKGTRAGSWPGAEASSSSGAAEERETQHVLEGSDHRGKRSCSAEQSPRTGAKDHDGPLRCATTTSTQQGVEAEEDHVMLPVNHRIILTGDASATSDKVVAGNKPVRGRKTGEKLTEEKFMSQLQRNMGSRPAEGGGGRSLEVPLSKISTTTEEGVVDDVADEVPVPPVPPVRAAPEQPREHRVKLSAESWLWLTKKLPKSKEGVKAADKLDVFLKEQFSLQKVTLGTQAPSGGRALVVRGISKDVELFQECVSCEVVETEIRFPFFVFLHKTRGDENGPLQICKRNFRCKKVEVQEKTVTGVKTASNEKRPPGDVSGGKRNKRNVGTGTRAATNHYQMISSKRFPNHVAILAQGRSYSGILIGEKRGAKSQLCLLN